MDYFLKKGGKRYVNRFRGFTLIELLIVVAIIGILAAIAIPNFLQAQIRAKVARVVSDVRTIDMACREHQVDQGSFIPCNNYALALNTGVPGDTWPTLALLTTPTEYLRGVSFEDPFIPMGRYANGFIAATADPSLISTRVYKYALFNDTGFAQSNDPVRGKWYYLESAGPDRFFHNMSGILLYIGNNTSLVGRLIYDPTNGTVSNGSIWRVGGQKTPYSGTTSATTFYDLVVEKYGGG